MKSSLFIVLLLSTWLDWVNHPVVMTALIAIGLIGITIELFNPGFGAPGIIGILSFGLYFYAQMESGAIGWLTPILFIVGVLFLVFEVVFTSFGIFGLLGILL